MKNIKVIIAACAVFLVLIIVVFLPALKSGDEGYKTKQIAEQLAQPADEMTEELATAELAREKVIDTAPVDETEDAVTKQQTPLVTMVDDKAEEVVVATESTVKEAVSTLEATVAADETEVIEQPAIPVTEAVMATVESTKTASTAEGLYSVVDGNKLDASSYAGFKLFRNWCARCHGTYGQGMAGPDLAESLKFISKEQFYDTVKNGKSGRIGSMPSWNANVEVMENLDQLYAYLKARSDGAIGVEKPQKQ
ncbi:MAG: c-type cytochrome [Pseudomonadota bacterium]|nr:c-type cytochrome [Pseudomonadota bacterium]